MANDDLAASFSATFSLAGDPFLLGLADLAVLAMANGFLRQCIVFQWGSASSNAV